MNIKAIKQKIRVILSQFDCEHLLDEDKIVIRCCSLIPKSVATTLEIKSPYGYDLYIINISSIHWSIVPPKMKQNIIAHETCHVLVSHFYGTIDFGGDDHGDEWKIFMSKLEEEPNISYPFSDEEVAKIRVQEILKIKKKNPWLFAIDIAEIFEISTQHLRNILLNHTDQKYKFFVACLCGKSTEISKRKANAIKHGKLYRCKKCGGFFYGVRGVPIKKANKDE